MQTFLPYSNFNLSAKVLDRQRLGKQRVEAMQILSCLMDATTKKGWVNHPAVKMWKGFELALAEYAYAVCDEWTSRGYKDTCKEKIRWLVSKKKGKVAYPKWLGSEDFHTAHRSNLIRKKPEHYGKLWPDIPSNLEYVWPTKDHSQVV